MSLCGGNKIWARPLHWKKGGIVLIVVLDFVLWRWILSYANMFFLCYFFWSFAELGQGLWNKNAHTEQDYVPTLGWSCNPPLDGREAADSLH